MGGLYKVAIYIFFCLRRNRDLALGSISEAGGGESVCLSMNSGSVVSSYPSGPLEHLSIDDPQLFLLQAVL